MKCWSIPICLGVSLYYMYWPYISNSSIETKQHWSCDRTCVTQPSFSFETIDGICFACLCLALTGQYKLCLYHGCHPCWTSTSNLFNVDCPKPQIHPHLEGTQYNDIVASCDIIWSIDLGSIHPTAVFCKGFFLDSVGEQLAFKIVSLTTLTKTNYHNRTIYVTCIQRIFVKEEKTRH